MHDMVKRHQSQVLRAAGQSQEETAELAAVSVPTVRRVEKEAPVTALDGVAAVRKRRKIGRPTKVEPFRALIVELCAEEDHSVVSASRKGEPRPIPHSSTISLHVRRLT